MVSFLGGPRGTLGGCWSYVRESALEASQIGEMKGK